MKHSPARSPRADRRAGGGNPLFRAGVGGFLLGLAILFALAFALAFVALQTSDPSSAVFPASLFCTAAAGYGGSLLAAGTASSRDVNPFLGALTAGGALTLFLLLLSLAVPATGASLLHRVSPLLLFPASSALAGLTVSAHRPNRNRRLKKLQKRIR